MKFNSQICTSREQSRRLLALGLKPETADMSSDGWNDPVVSWGMEWNGMEWSKEVIESGRLPAWSLHRLLMMLDSDVQTDGRYISLPHYGFVKKDNIYDNLCDCIEWLIQEGYFNLEYLV